MLWHVLMRLRQAGFERIVINVHHFAGQIIRYLQDNHNFGMGTELLVSDESQGLLDTGGGLKRAARLFDSGSPVLIHNVDILSNADLNRLYDAGGKVNETAPYLGQNSVLLVSERPSTRHLFFADDMRLMGWRNETTGEEKKPLPDIRLSSLRPLAFSGIHVIAPSLLGRMNAPGSPWPDRFGIIDFYLWAAAERAVIGQEQAGLRLLDVGKLDTLEQAEQFIKQI